MVRITAPDPPLTLLRAVTKIKKNEKMKKMKKIQKTAPSVKRSGVLRSKDRIADMKLSRLCYVQSKAVEM